MVASETHRDYDQPARRISSATAGIFIAPDVSRGITMQRSMLMLLAAAALVLAGGTARADSPRQKSARLEKQVPVTLNYLLYLPELYDQQESWPLLLFLHGAGERGDDLSLVKKHGPPKLIDQGKSFPMIVVSPQCPQGSWWTTRPLELTALLDEIASQYKVDPDRVYLTGLSMGGFGTWTLAAYSPQRFAAIVPICGGGEPLITRALGHMPTWVFHGAKDPVVPLERSETMVEALKKVNNNVKFTVYPDALHDSWTATYDNPEVYEWLLGQRRPSAGQGQR
jgi:predicted peptidase